LLLEAQQEKGPDVLVKNTVILLLNSLIDMRRFLLTVAFFAFLYSSWAPSWGHHLANWLLILVGLVVFGSASAKATAAGHRRRHGNDSNKGYYDGQYYRRYDQ
jgi:hypothetical protein